MVNTNPQDLAKEIYLFNDDKHPFEARWDGQDYRIEKQPIVVKLGVALHWQGTRKDSNLRIEEVPAEEIAKRIPANPLEENNRGEAFAGLKRTRKRASGE